MKKQRKVRRPARRQVLGRTSLQEVKAFDCPIAGVAPLPVLGAIAAGEPAAAFAGITELNCVPQGATVANRIGNKIVVRSIHLRTSIGAVAPNQGEVRVALLYDRQPNGAFPAFTDMFINQPAGAATNYSSMNIANKSRFLILRDQFFTIDVAQSLLHSINWYCKGRWECEFGGNAGTIVDFRTGSFLLVAYTSLGGPVSLNTGVARLRYYD